MAEELKHLIEQIQREGVEEASKQADAIVSQAKEKAAKIVSEAEKHAHDTVERAKREAEASAERSVKTLEQAARDLLITLGQGCERVVSAILAKEVDAALSGDFLQKTILTVIGQGNGSSIDLIVGEKDKEKLAAFCAELARKSGQAINLSASSEILSGFKIGFKNKNVYLDFTGEALGVALSAFLRPELAKTVSRIAREQTVKA